MSKESEPKRAQDVLCTVVEVRRVSTGVTRTRVLAAGARLRAGAVSTPAGPKLYVEVHSDTMKSVRLEVPARRGDSLCAALTDALEAARDGNLEQIRSGDAEA